MLNALFFIVTALTLTVAVLAIYGMVHSLLQVPEIPATGATRSRTTQR
jgi:hypothetical protein